MDVLRGFALLGILLMNVEAFSRPLQDIDDRRQSALQRRRYLAGWLDLRCSCSGKFMTLFSLLFGMGFAVML